MTWDQFWHSFLSSLDLVRLITTLVGGATLGYFVFGMTATKYSVGVLAASSYARSTGVLLLLVGGVFYIPPLAVALLRNSGLIDGDPDPAWPRFLGAYLVWGLLCLTLSLGIWARIEWITRTRAHRK